MNNMKHILRGIFFLSITILVAQNKENKKKYDYVITIKTKFGDMKALLFDETPLHKENFLKLVRQKFYDSTTFHRIIPNFMIQGGDPNSKDNDPNNDGMGGPGYTIPAEIKPELKHIRGAISAARLPDAINPQKESSGSQFFIVQNPEGAPYLDGHYTVFGEVFDDLEVIDMIANQPRDYKDRPLENIYMVITAEKMSKKKIKKLYGYSKNTFK
jgi:cyclophilin family peptidyl-prolyl cis-trans isomerase